MKRNTIFILFLSLVLMGGCTKENQFVIENEALSRTLSIENQKLNTIKITNKKAGKDILPQNTSEFRIRISEGTHLEGTDVVLTSDDFLVKEVLVQKKEKLGFLLENPEHQLKVSVYYETAPGNFWLNKYLVIQPDKKVTLERIDVECISLDDIYQPYQIRQITAQGPAQWRPGLGQPLYTSESGTFWGTEFPASWNYVENNTGFCGYLWGHSIDAGEKYNTYKAVAGAGDDPRFIQDSFFEYIDRIRIRPLRLQIQYNSWFDFGPGVKKETFAESVQKVHQELVEERGVPPLKAYVIDDGWEDVNANWSEKAWKVNQKFENNFDYSKSAVQQAASNLGLWLSPGCLFGAQPAALRFREQGFEVLGNWMSMAGPRYMQLFEDRILELTRDGITYFKLDGLFGHLNIREFELNGNKYGIPWMPQLGTAGLSASDEKLNSHKFDELKTYYLVAGTERLMEIFQKQHKVNPDVYVVISNGAYLSPWWLMHIDAVWMINAGDAAAGSSRTEELVYRDGVYYQTWVKEKTQFPINAVFNHEPKKRQTGEPARVFREYLLMNLSRGTGFIELYIKTQNLSESDWDVMAEGLKWAHHAFPWFKYAKMHGGDPSKAEVYGYTGWKNNSGYASFHNPSQTPQKYTFPLNRSMGVSSVNNTFELSSPLENGQDLAGKTFSEGSNITVSLEPGEVKLYEFHRVQKSKD